jgi:UDP-2,3-diacylglucosamine pyrophosphatase LpxH
LPFDAGSPRVAAAHPPRAGDPGAAGGNQRLRTIWISDVHLGTKGARADLLCGFLEAHPCQRLYLVGDIVDMWALKRSWYWDASHTRVVELVVGLAASGTRVVYVPGNHDASLRPHEVELAGIRVRREVVHRTADGRRLLVIHGDEFDQVVRCHPWLAHVGDRAYQVALVINRWFNAGRRLCGLPYWSLSQWLKHKVKDAVAYVGEFERAVVAEALRRGVDGVVCGHIHKAELREVDGVLYANDGDWVESCSALVEHQDGRLELVRWAEAVAQRAVGAPNSSSV